MITKTGDGLLYRTDFSTLTGWTVGSGWVIDTTHQTYVAFPSAINLLDPTAVGGIDGGGIREPHLIVLESGRWYLFYDAGTGLNDSTGPWRIKLAYSDDRGVSWTRLDAIGVAPVTPFYCRAMSGFISYYPTDGYYYLHSLGADSMGGPYSNVPNLNYHNSIWRASNIEGPWTIVRDEDPPLGGSGSFDETTVCVSSVVNISGVYTALYSTRSAVGAYNPGRATASSPAGTFTKDGLNGLMHTSVNDGPGGVAENPKLWYSSTLGRWVILANELNFVDDRIGLWTASTPTGFRTSGDVLHFNLQRPINPIDGIRSQSVAAPFYDREGTVLEEADGAVAYVYGCEPDVESTLTRQRLKQGVLEASATALSLPASTAATWITRDFASNDLVAEFTIEISGAEGQTGFAYRVTGGTSDATTTCYYVDFDRSNGTAHLYKLVSGTRTQISSTANLPTRAFAPNTVNVSHERIKVVASGSSHSCYANDVLLYSYTDSSIASGTKVGFRGESTTGGAAAQRVRLFSVRSADAITLTQLTPGASVVLRGAGGIAAAVATADGSGNASLSHWHYPLKTVEVDGTDLSPAGGVWGGDTFQGQQTPTLMSAITTIQVGTVRTKRVTTGSVLAGLSALVTVTWPTTFADTNYTATVNVLDSTAAVLGLTILHVESISASAITVRVLNTAIGDLTGTLHAIAIHD